MGEAILSSRINQLKRLRDSIIKINYFDEKETLSHRDQLLATRIFLSSLTITLAIVTIFTAVTLQTQTITIQSPSETTFNHLSILYPSTLSCPCQQTSIRQNEFLSFHPQYHPICTSQFINQTFISSSLSDMNMSDYWPLDYRIMMASHFQILSLLCQTIKQTIVDSVEEFSNGYIISNRVLFHAAFDAQMIALVDELKTTTIANNRYASDFLWFSMYQNGVYSGLRTNYYIQDVPNAATTKYLTASYLYRNKTCSCLNNDTCMTQGGIYNWTGRAGVGTSTVFGKGATDPPLLFNIPGIMIGCLPYNSLLQSTVQCFYDQSCIDVIQTFINELSLVSPLSPSRFPQNTTIDDLLDELLIESWNNQSNFSNYFQVCSPDSCTYSYDRRFNILYVIVTIISLFGGLRIVTSFCAPYIVELIRRIQKMKCCRKVTDKVITETQETINQSLKDRIVSFVRQIYQQIVTLNLFPYSSDMKDGIYSTRIYILVLIIGIVSLFFYASIATHTRSITVYQPSLTEYRRLYDQYPSTLICPCTHLSMSYQSIMNVQSSYHQICSSDFIKADRWLLYYRGQSGAFFPSDFRISGVQFFILLQTLCRMSNETVSNELSVFNDMQFVSGQVLMKDIFNEQTSALIQQFQSQTVTSFVSLFQLLRTSIQLNQFIVGNLNNANLNAPLTYDRTLTRFTPRNDYDNGCSCGTNSSCTRSQGFYCRTTPCFLTLNKPNQTIPGLVHSCLPMDSLLASSFQCFYNAPCLQMLMEWRLFDSSNVTTDSRLYNITPLDPLINSRYSPYTTLDNIVSQLFIENWTDSSNFTSYYQQCSPNECTYTYEESFNIVYLISTIVGIIGGLSVALRIIIPPIVKLLRRIYHQCFKHQSQVVREAFVERSTNKCITFI